MDGQIFTPPLYTCRVEVFLLLVNAELGHVACLGQ
jgi:hypothetical protein